MLPQLALAAVAAASVYVVASEKSGAEKQSRPNILFILIDDAGFSDFGSYGTKSLLQILDLIAQEGVRFTNFHVASRCEATRVMLQSGRGLFHASADKTW